MYGYESRIGYSQSNTELKLTFSGVVDLFQDCSTFQSEDLGIGYGFLKDQGMFWVVNSWQIVADRMPEMGERVRVCTSPYKLQGFLGCRNFYLTDLEGKYLVRANSVWSLLSIETGRPTKMPEELPGRYEMEERLDMVYASRKIKLPEGGREQAKVRVEYHHLDANHHVNNGQYVKIADCYLLADLPVKQLRVEYREQAFLGDVMTPVVYEEAEKVVVALMDAQGKPITIVEYSGQEG